MDPIAFSLFGLEIRWYGLLIGTGVLIGILLAQYTCKIKKIDYDHVLNIILIALPVGIIGARLYYVLFNFEFYSDDFIQIFNIRGGGLAIHGGLIFGFIAALIYAKKKSINFLEYADAIVPSIVFAQALGRWGNFFNGEAHGSVVSKEFISKFPDFIQKGMYIDGEFYHPTFLYESISDLLIFIILMVVIRKSKEKGNIVFLYLFLYSIARFFIEGLRTDSLMLGDIRVAQLVSILAIVASIVFFVCTYYRKKH